jgi:hypothetical protein
MLLRAAAVCYCRRAARRCCASFNAQQGSNPSYPFVTACGAQRVADARDINNQLLCRLFSRSRTRGAHILPAAAAAAQVWLSLGAAVAWACCRRSSRPEPPSNVSPLAHGPVRVCVEFNDVADPEKFKELYKVRKVEQQVVKSGSQRTEESFAVYRVDQAAS